MKIPWVGLGLCALSVCIGGCSGSASTAPPQPDAGMVSDAGDAGGSDAGDAGGSDAGPSSDASTPSEAGEAGAPSEPSCTAGTYSCDGQTLRLCSNGGVPQFNRQCAADEYCDPRRALCVPQVCTPGATSCDGARVQVCNDAGSDFTAKQTCSVSQVCSSGACQDIACVPNTTFCRDGGVWSCGTDGTTSTLTQHCTSDQFCLEKDRVATCNATACFAGDAMCAGNVATQCEPDGSGPKPGGNDCAQSSQTCYSGECRDAVCTPGQKLCDNNSAYLCADGGTSRILLATCAAGEACDPASGTCQSHLCDPGTLGCDSTRVVTCNPSGTGWLQSGTDCGASNAICVAGSCKPLVCTPSAVFCEGDNVYQCSTDGTTKAVSSDCVDSGYYCIPAGTYAYCYPHFCQPNAAGCNGNLLTTCKADGSGWTAGGTDCGQSNAVCSNAQCVAKVCTPGASFCADGNVQQCDYLGTSSSRAKVCTYGTYCRAQSNLADCAPTPCLPDTDACAAEKFGHCTADGMGVAAGASDCGAFSEVCTLQGCAASAVDTIATGNQLATGTSYYNFVGDVVDVQSARKLTNIEFFLSLPSAHSLVWAVFQSNVVNGFNEFDLKYQKTTTASGTGFQSSGTIGLELEAGKTYAIGVSVSDGNFVYYFDNTSTQASLNFAHAVGSVSSTFAPTFTYYQSSPLLYYARLTTSAP